MMNQTFWQILTCVNVRDSLLLLYFRRSVEFANRQNNEMSFKWWQSTSDRANKHTKTKTNKKKKKETNSGTSHVIFCFELLIISPRRRMCKLSHTSFFFFFAQLVFALFFCCVVSRSTFHGIEGVWFSPHEGKNSFRWKSARRQRQCRRRVDIRFAYACKTKMKLFIVFVSSVKLFFFCVFSSTGKYENLMCHNKLTFLRQTQNEKRMWKWNCGFWQSKIFRRFRVLPNISRIRSDFNGASIEKFQSRRKRIRDGTKRNCCQCNLTHEYEYDIELSDKAKFWDWIFVVRVNDLWTIIVFNSHSLARKLTFLLLSVQADREGWWITTWI